MECNGGLILGPDSKDSVLVLLLPGEHAYDANGRLLFAVGGEVAAQDSAGEEPQP